ncbi:TolC family protein [Sphingobium terrigena]|uniref:TolC family protein n=1 Tax=Sphingobium terrigena TaxID=2304063 RepID=A0A418YRY3_9SPHN|nr:TolC family protein [Sphingobium terrigena]RJG54511.1 TolC family protein [Sphingobium terrigena]
MFPSVCPRAFPRLTVALLVGAFFPALPLAAQGLSLTDALSRVAQADPGVAVTAAQRDAATAAMRQAEVRPQDVVTVDLEDLARTGPYTPIASTQTTAWYERTWERGGKREARVGAARLSRDVTQQRGRLRQLDILAQAQAAWVEALAAEAEIPVALERLTLAQRLEREVARRVGRALDPLFALERARTAVAQARIAHEQAIEAARLARMSLAAWWGADGDVQIDTSSFSRLAPDPAADAQPIDVALLDAERDAAAARARLAEANSATDPTLRAGLRHYGQGNDVSIVVGGSIPLGGRRAQRGNVEQAEAERRVAEAEIAVLRVQVKRDMDRLLAQRAAIVREINKIDNAVLPSAERAVMLVRDGYNRGGTAFTFLEVTQAQEAMIDAYDRRITLLKSYHLDGARLDRLTGRYAPLLASAENR